MIPMYSIEAEQSVIGACLIDGSLVNQISEIVQPMDFFRADHRDLFSGMLSMAARGAAIDIISLGDEITRIGGRYDIGYAGELCSGTPSTANAKSYAEIVAERSRKRALVATLDQCSRMAMGDQSLTPDDLIAHVAAQIGAMQVKDGEGLRNTTAVLQSLALAWDRRMRDGGEIDGLATGIGSVDSRHNGWKSGDLVVVAGRPAMGKSVFAAQVALHNAVYHNKHALIFSLEMTAEQLLERATANLAKVHLDVFRKGDGERWGVHSHEIGFAAGQIKKCPLMIDDTPALHINQICARARNLHRKKPLSLVVVDHIHIVTATGQSREREIASITGSLKALAKELGCPVVAVAQLNRGVEQRPNKRPGMADLRDSGSVEQDADIITLLYRDDYYNPDSQNPGVIEVITAKFREGETGTDYCAHKLHMGRIEDLAPGYEFHEPDESGPGDKGFRGFRGKA